MAAIVLGTEKSGLTNAQIALCHRICHIPANPQYSSLNVAQALQLAAWELRYALLIDQGAALLPVSTAQEPSRGAEPASSEAVQAFLAHWESALVEVRFLDPVHPKLMPRMRHLFSRAGLTRDEVDMMRGVCTAMLTDYRNSRKNRQKGTEIPSLSVRPAIRRRARAIRRGRPRRPAALSPPWRPRP